MTAWTDEELSRIGEAQELRLASARPDGAMRRYVTMWVVRAGDDLYVRSAYGPNNPWFRGAKASGAGRIRAGGLERDVVFAEPAPGVHAAIDAAYHAKYDRYGPKMVGTVVGPGAEAVTIKLVPRSASSQFNRRRSSRRRSATTVGGGWPAGESRLGECADPPLASEDEFLRLTGRAPYP